MIIIIIIIIIVFISPLVRESADFKFFLDEKVHATGRGGEEAATFDSTGGLGRGLGTSRTAFGATPKGLIFVIYIFKFYPKTVF